MYGEHWLEVEPTPFLTHQGCRRAFSQVYRSLGSFSSKWQIKSLAKRSNERHSS